ncbi:tRNA pseudouridine synthase A [Olea europaea subsp. europaea]|uniref:tRNA pseudouridine synthase A n=1 Tax=Olea europaea subsp. europaea TaxID=158383 RepID=A0A8S0TW44_OLEEU|nr:tRNA pseudouridine synthase A [Olea europaea subsp. europaea]
MIKYPSNRMVGLNPSNPMGSPALKKKDYNPYNHTDACRHTRWTAKECYQFMSARPWQKVNDFYSYMVKGCISLSELFGKETYAIHDGTEIIEDCDKSQLASVTVGDRTGRWARVTFKIVLSYHGGSFDGWQKQPGLNTVQAWIEKSLGKFVDEKKAQLLKEKNLPIEGCVVVAGRTDKGVSALKQVCSFFTWRKDIKDQDVEESINGAAPGKIRVVSVSKVSREFHPNFSAKWRRYLYILPLNNETEGDHTSLYEKDIVDSAVCRHGRGDQSIDEASNGYAVDVDNKDDEETGNKSSRFLVSSVNHLLHQLEGKLLSYRMFARDTKASRNIGPPTECFVFHARAAEVLLPCAEKEGSPTKTMCIELVANRFLRRVFTSTNILMRKTSMSGGKLTSFI